MSANRGEAGGLSGRPLFEPATRLLAAAWRETGGRVPLVGVGGVDGPEAAYAKIRAGASLVQLYSALIYDGPGLVARILDGLLVRLEADGFATVIGRGRRRSPLERPPAPAGSSIVNHISRP